jgi:HIV Tat-specific factor 1
MDSGLSKLSEGLGCFTSSGRDSVSLLSKHLRRLREIQALWLSKQRSRQTPGFDCLPVGSGLELYIPSTEMTSSIQNDPEQWFAVTNPMEQKANGPFQKDTLLKMLDKGVIFPNTMVYNNDQSLMDSKPMILVDAFREVCVLLCCRWYFLDAERQQQGPLVTKALLQKIDDGDLNGFSLVYSVPMPAPYNKDYTDSQWKQFSEVEPLKNMYQRMQMEQMMTETVKNNDHGIESTIAIADDEGEKEREAKKAYMAMIASQTQQQAQEGEDKKAERTTEIATTDNHHQIYKGIKDTDSRTVDNTHTKSKKASPKSKWVYITGLPSDISMEEVQKHFSKVGLIALNAHDQTPLIKLYRNKDGSIKGDGSICYFLEDSVNLALNILDGGYIRPSHQIRVQQSDTTKFTTNGTSRDRSAQDKGDEDTNPPAKKQKRAEKGQNKAHKNQVDTARRAMMQALSWNDDEEDAQGKQKQSLRIIVLQNAFHPREFSTAGFEAKLQQNVGDACSEYGAIEKITVYSKHSKGVCLIKYKSAVSAQRCVENLNGQQFLGRQVRVTYWDHITDYDYEENTQDAREAARKVAEEEESRREEDFGNWLDEQEDLPEEFRLQKEN